MLDAKDQVEEAMNVQKWQLIAEKVKQMGGDKDLMSTDGEETCEDLLTCSIARSVPVSVEGDDDQGRSS